MPTKRPPKIATPEFKKEVCRYALMDAKSSLALFERYHMDWPDTEVEISRMTREMGMRGVPINVEKARAAEATLLAECERTKKLIPWADDAETSLLSLAAIRRQCEIEGIRAPVSFAEKSDDGSAWEEEFSDRFPWVSAVREYRKANKHLKTVQTMLSRVKPDGWMPYELKYFGAHSGRDSGASGWNCQNVPKGIVAGVDIRSLIEAPEGKTLVICDLSQIEPRVLAWLAEDTAMLDYIRGCADLYEAQARAWGMWDKPEKLRTDPATRHVIKTLNIGLGYQMGAARFSASAGVSTAEAERLVGLYRSKNPKICGRGGFWEMLGRKIAFATSRPDKTLRIHLPSGRSCIYRDVCRKGGDITCLLPGKSGKFERRKMFPGGICENLTQAVARDVFMSRCLLLREQGYEILMRVHDEAVILVDEDSASDDAKVIESIMSTPPAWCDDLPMGAESKISKFYTK
jgi:hypothetical protein